MSIIKYYPEDDKYCYLTTYYTKLQYYINKVLNVIGENDDGITWYICNEADFPNRRKQGIGFPSPLYSDFSYVMNPQYGICDIKNKRIWISTLALANAPSLMADVAVAVDFVQCSKFKPIRLVEVIIDEFTHIKTERNHGDPIYDKTKVELLRKFYTKYYRRYLSINNIFV